MSLSVGPRPLATRQTRRAPPATPGLGGGDDLVGLQPGVLEHVRAGADPLRAVEAVLGAEPALDVDQVVQLDPAAEELAPDAERRRHHVHQLVVAAREHREGFVAGREFAGERLVRERVKPRHGTEGTSPGTGRPGGRCGGGIESAAVRSEDLAMRIAILDDYQHVALSCADWDSLGADDRHVRQPHRRHRRPGGGAAAVRRDRGDARADAVHRRADRAAAEPAAARHHRDAQRVDRRRGVRRRPG